MNWVIIIWSGVASACLTLAAMHLLVWLTERTAWADSLFSVAAVATAAVSFCELWMAANMEDFASARELLEAANARLFLRFRDDMWGKRRLRKPDGGVATFGGGATAHQAV